MVSLPLLGAAAAIALITSCTDGGPPRRITSWALELPEEGLNRGQFEDRLRQAMAETSLRPQRGAQAEGGATLVVSIVRQVGRLAAGDLQSSTTAPFACLVRLKLPPAPELGLGPRPIRIVGQASLVDLSATAAGPAMAAALRQARETWELLEGGKSGWQRALVEGARPAEEGAGQPETTGQRLAKAIQAMAWLADARVVQSVPTLLAVLTDGASDDASAAKRLLSKRAVGALALMGDRRAVLPLIACAQHKEGREVAQLATAVGLIGGRTAEGWLTTLASGHDDAQVRAAAALSLRALTRATMTFAKE